MAIRHLKKLSDLEKEKIIDLLKTFLQSHEEIVFALLYGSLVDPIIPGKYGDIDLALYVRPGGLMVPNYVFESRIEAEIYHLLSIQRLNFLPIEALVINHAPYSFLSKLFKGRYIILKEDEETLTDFIDEVGKICMDNSHLRYESLGEVIGD